MNIELTEAQAKAVERFVREFAPDAGLDKIPNDSGWTSREVNALDDGYDAIATAIEKRDREKKGR